MHLFDLSGNRALVTGGARGLGRGIAHGIKEAGATVAIIARFYCIVNSIGDA